MSLRDRVPKVSKLLQKHQRVLAKHPYTKAMSLATVILPYRYTTMVEFDMVPNVDDQPVVHIVANADIEENFT